MGQGSHLLEQLCLVGRCFGKKYRCVCVCARVGLWFEGPFTLGLKGNPKKNHIKPAGSFFSGTPAGGFCWFVFRTPGRKRQRSFDQRTGEESHMFVGPPSLTDLPMRGPGPLAPRNGIVDVVAKGDVLEEAAEFALSHPPAPISKREVPKTNRRGQIHRRSSSVDEVQKEKLQKGSGKTSFLLRRPM